MTSRTSKPAPKPAAKPQPVAKPAPIAKPPPPPVVAPVVAAPPPPPVVVAPPEPPKPPPPPRVEVHARRVGATYKLDKVTLVGDAVVAQRPLEDCDTTTSGTVPTLQLLSHIKVYAGVKEPFVLVLKR